MNFQYFVRRGICSDRGIIPTAWADCDISGDWVTIWDTSWWCWTWSWPDPSVDSCGSGSTASLTHHLCSGHRCGVLCKEVSVVNLFVVSFEFLYILVEYLCHNLLPRWGQRIECSKRAGIVPKGPLFECIKKLAISPFLRTYSVTHGFDPSLIGCVL